MSNSITRLARVSPALMAMFAAALLAFQSTGAAFSATTENAGDAFTAGTVTLSDNDAGTAMFPMLNMEPLDPAVGCIEVTYSGTLDPLVKTYGAITAGDGLEDYLDLTIERGTGTCAAFGTSTAVWTNGTDGDLGIFLGAATNYATGVDTWQPTGGGPADVVPYRFTVTLQDNVLAQAKSVTVTFTWEAQNL
ncbi:MAG: hypothetical protein V3U39_08125 [Acidimicrobiia bacterium]